jgi:hypothetical protein
MAMSGPTDPGSPSRSELECRQIAELLGEYLEGTLSKRTMELIEWHIDGCAPCVAFINTYRGTVNVTRSVRDLPIPPELKNRLLAVLRARQSQ